VIPCCACTRHPVAVLAWLPNNTLLQRVGAVDHPTAGRSNHIQVQKNMKIRTTWFPRWPIILIKSRERARESDGAASLYPPLSHKCSLMTWICIVWRWLTNSSREKHCRCAYPALASCCCLECAWESERPWGAGAPCFRLLPSSGLSRHRISCAAAQSTQTSTPCARKTPCNVSFAPHERIRG
jgi:hypothetical protein